MQAGFHDAMLEFELSLDMSLINNTLKEVTVYTNDDISEVLNNPRFKGHSRLLVRNADVEDFFFEKNVGVIEKDNCATTGKVKDCMVPVRGGFVEIHAPIVYFIEMNVPYAFVGDDDGIRGFVAESDLLKPAVRILAFTLATHLEWFLRRAIEVHVTDERTLQKFISGRNMSRYRDDKRRNTERPLTEYTELYGEIEALKEVRFFSQEDAEELHTIRDMRNGLGHGYSDIQDFIPRLHTTIKWLEQLANILGY